MARLFELDPYSKTLSSIRQNPKLCIGRAPLFWRNWLEKGIVTLGDLYLGGILNSNLESLGLHFLRYLQHQHLLAGSFRSSSSALNAPECFNKVLLKYGKGHEASGY